MWAKAVNRAKSRGCPKSRLGDTLFLDYAFFFFQGFQTEMMMMNIVTAI